MKFNSLRNEEERRSTQHETVKEQLRNQVNDEIQRKAEIDEEKTQIESVAHDLRHKAIHEVAATEGEVSRARHVARISQVVDYLFGLVYGLLALLIALELLGARESNAFKRFIDVVTLPLVGPFKGLMPDPRVGNFQLMLSYIIGLIVYGLLQPCRKGPAPPDRGKADNRMKAIAGFFACSQRRRPNVMGMVIVCAVSFFWTGPLAAQIRTMDLSLANDVHVTETLKPGDKGPMVLRAQILLDRAAFSPGEIDATYGANLGSAIRGFQKAHQLPVTDDLGPETWTALDADKGPVLIPYDITPQDVAGPFQRIPVDMMAKSKLPSLGYQSPLELLGERFHVSPKVLTRLNKGKNFGRVGEHILAPNVDAPSETAGKAASVVVRKSDLTVSALDDRGTVIAQFPASAGSEHDPLPIGKWTIKGVAKDPPFNYNPELFWDAEPGHSMAKIAPGPNNPVGVVWIDLSKPHYGIHGTSEPSQIGHTQTHGCIRLTNWDAMRLARMVPPGTPVVISE